MIAAPLMGIRRIVGRSLTMWSRRALTSAALVVLSLWTCLGVPCAAEAAEARPDASPVVAIVYEKLQETGDKAADDAKNQATVSAMVAKAIDLAGGLDGLVKDGQRVLIKPNLTNLRWGRYVPGMTTDCRVAAAVVDAIAKKARCKLVFGEGSGLEAQTVYDACGYTAIAKAHGIDLVDFRHDTLVPAKVEDAMADKEYSLPKTFLEADVVINVPCLKANILTGISVAMKNYYGLLPVPRGRWHDRAEEVLTDLAKARRSDLVVVDGLVGMEGQGALWGNPVKSNVIVAGRDMVAVDTVCAALMGYDPKRVLHLQYAQKKGLGVADLSRITVKGNRIDEVKKDYEPPRWTVVVTCPKTAANMKLLLEKGSNKEPLYSYRTGQREHVGWEVSWPKEALKVNKAKYPGRESWGFTAQFDKFEDDIRFEVFYKTLFREEIPAAREEMQKWIQEHMETKAPPEPAEIPPVAKEAKGR